MLFDALAQTRGLRFQPQVVVLQLLDLVLLSLNLPFCLCKAIEGPTLCLLRLLQLFFQLIVSLKQLLPVLGGELKMCVVARVAQNRTREKL